MQYFKLQIGCMLIVLYVAFIYIREKYEYKVKQKEPVFELLLITGILSIVFDGATAYTVNYLDKVPGLVNAVLHACFLCGLDTLSFVIFLYMYDITRGVPKSRKIKTLIILPLAICIAVVILFMPQLEYRSGRITNYSMGISAYTCFIMVAVYMLGTVILLVKGWRNMGHHKLITLTTCIAAANVVTIYQMIYPESLISCLVPTFVIIGSYLNVENPLFTKLQAHNREMVMGFATLVENRDGSTGGHIRRTTTYVKLLAEELQKRGMYKGQLTQDYIENLTIAAPMHDVGKIAIPDAILQKPGRLTDEEFAIMRTHAEKGGEIIKETFGHIGDGEYEKMAYEVARYHHEKFDGGGYPEGLTGDEIPIGAQLVSLADVYDALISKRCYKPSFSYDTAYQMILDGECGIFNPRLLQCFIKKKNELESMAEQFKD